MVTITHKLRLRFSEESYDEFIRLYDERAETCRAIYNWAVGECAEDDRRAYVQGKGKPYMDKANRKLAKHVAKQAGVKVNDILNLVRFQLAGHGWYYPDPPDATDIRYRLRQGSQSGAVPKTGYANAPGCTRWAPYLMR